MKPIEKSISGGKKYVCWYYGRYCLDSGDNHSWYCSCNGSLCMNIFTRRFFGYLVVYIQRSQGKLSGVAKARKTKSSRFVSLAAIIGGPVGMTGYVLSIANRGASIGAVVFAIFPTIGAVLACIFLKDDHLCLNFQ